MAISNLMPGTTYAIHLRAPSVSGGKDWVGSVTSNGEIHTFWGKTGQVNQHGGKKGNMTSLQHIIDEKKVKGYDFVDDYTPQQGWQSQRQPSSPQATPPPTAVPEPPPVPKGPAVKILKDNQEKNLMAPINWDF